MGESRHGVRCNAPGLWRIAATALPWINLAQSKVPAACAASAGPAILTGNFLFDAEEMPSMHASFQPLLGFDLAPDAFTAHFPSPTQTNNGA